METVDILVIGGGAAGMAAAKAAWEAGCPSVLLADCREGLGGVLGQCLHRGFGPGLSGPEYIEKLAADFPREILLWLNTTVLEVREDRTANMLGPEIGERTVRFRQLILASGCREIPMGALPIGGTRPEGIYTAGQMQEMTNLYGFRPRGPAVILGSGDLGLLMADRLAQLGLSVTLVEKEGTCGGMARNRKCLENPGIRLHCGATVTEVFGEKEISSVLLTDGTEYPCRTLLIAAGLQPDREIVRGLEGAGWLQLCGNCRRVHPMIETVVNEGAQAGRAAWEKIRGGL